ncbi:MAG TPA: hypothetical protein VF532_13925 [Candidatus Angelobacter sp.]
MSASAMGINQPMEKKPTWTYLLGQSYQLYQQRYWVLFRMALLPALLTYFWPYFQRLAFRRISEIFGVKSGPPTPGAWVIFFGAGWVKGAVYWAISAFFFAAVASNILRHPDETRHAFSDAYTQARDRIGAVIAAALLCWTLFWVSTNAAQLAIFEIRFHFFLHPGPYSRLVVFSLEGLVFLIPASLLSRLGLTIPALIHEPTATLGHALRTSLKKTENWEPFFMVFLVKSALLAYGLYWLAEQGLDWLWRHHALNTASFPWAARVFYISLAASLVSPLFIAFSLLYRESNRQQSGALAADPVE